jgi:flagellar L-ring protein precursor FlgH
MMRIVALLICLPVLFSGCSSVRPASAKAPDPVKLVIAPPEVKDGSLWQDRSVVASSLVSDDKARSKGDIVTILVVESVNAKRTRNTTTSKSQNATAGVDDVTFPGIGHVLGAAASVNGKKRDFNVGLSSKRDFTGGGTVTDSGEVRATISAQVVDVLPNDNLILMGTKEVTVSGEVQVVTLTGIARPKDITPENTINSIQLAEARVHITGSGPLDDAQRRTMVTKLLDWVNLF